MSQTSTAGAAGVGARARDLRDRRQLLDRGDWADRLGGATTPSLRVVRGSQLRTGSAAFAMLCAALLGAGLLALLLINTTLSQRAFTLHALQSSSAGLAATEDALTQQLAAERAPARLAARATRMGMVPAESVAFVRLSDNTVLGVAKAAQPQLAFSVVASPAPPGAVSAGVPGSGFLGTGSTSLRQYARARLPRTTSTSVSTKGRTTTTTTVTTVTDAPHDTVTVTTDAVAVTEGYDAAGTATTTAEKTTTVRRTRVTAAGTTTLTRVVRPDGSTSSTSMTTPGRTVGVTAPGASPAGSNRPLDMTYPMAR